MRRVIVLYKDVLGNKHEVATDDQETLNYIVNMIESHGNNHKIPPWKMDIRIICRSTNPPTTQILFPVPNEGYVMDVLIYDN